jgi:probable rRNA maturation factor
VPTALDVRVSLAARAPVSAAEAAHVLRAVLRAERVRWAVVSVAFVGRRRIRALNRRHLGRDRETDVIAFALEPGTGAWPRGRGVVGDLYVCPPVAAAQARRFGSSPREETRRLLVHGALHLLGWVHAEGRERTTGTMWRRQERLLARLGGAR